MYVTTGEVASSGTYVTGGLALTKVAPAQAEQQRSLTLQIEVYNCYYYSKRCFDIQ